METQGSGFGLPPLPDQEEPSTIGNSSATIPGLVNGGLRPQERPTPECLAIIKGQETILEINLNDGTIRYDRKDFPNQEGMLRQVQQDLSAWASRLVEDFYRSNE